MPSDVDTAPMNDQHRDTRSDADIAQAATLLPIADIARDRLGIVERRHHLQDRTAR